MRTVFCATVSPAPKQAEKLPSAAVERIWNWPKVSGERVTQPERETLPLAATVRVALAEPEPKTTCPRTPPLTVPEMVRPFWVRLTFEPLARLVTARPLRVCAELLVPVRLKVPLLLRLPLRVVAEALLKPGLNPGMFREAVKLFAVATPAETLKVKLALERL